MDDGGIPTIGETLSTNEVKRLKISKTDAYKISLTLKIFGLAIIMVGSLFVYTYLFQRFPQFESFHFSTLAPFHPQSLRAFIAYCTAFLVLITIFLKNRYKRIFQILLIGSLFFIAIAYGGLIIGINVLLLYYLISAYAEEYMKYSVGNNIFLANKEKNESNLIFFCILVGLGFSVVENMLYIANNLINSENINLMNLIIGRGLVSTLIHIVSTGLIAFIMIKTKRTKSFIMPVILGIIGGFGLHSIYNISLQYNLTYITIPIIILAFFLMSYLTFQSDIVYKQQQ